MPRPRPRLDVIYCSSHQPNPKPKAGLYPHHNRLPTGTTAQPGLELSSRSSFRGITATTGEVVISFALSTSHTPPSLAVVCSQPHPGLGAKMGWLWGGGGGGEAKHD